MLFRVSKILWILASLAVLLTTVFFYDGTANSDIDIFYTWSVLALSFPCGLILTLVISGAFYLLNSLWGIIVPVSIAYFMLTWLAYCAVGYMQWFWLTPKLIQFYRRQKTKREQSA